MPSPTPIFAEDIVEGMFHVKFQVNSVRAWQSSMSAALSSLFLTNDEAVKQPAAAGEQRSAVSTTCSRSVKREDEWR